MIRALEIRSILPGLKRKKLYCCSVVQSPLFRCKFCISFGNQGPRVWRKSGEAQNPCCLKSSVKFPQSVMIWAAMSSAGVGPLCFLKSSQRSHLPRHFREHYASFCWQALCRCWFHFPAGHTAKGTKSWFNDHDVTVLDWTANSPDLNPIEDLWGIVKRKMKDTGPNNEDDLKAAIKATWSSITPEQCHRLPPCHAALMQ